MVGIERMPALQKEFDPTTRIVVTGIGAITPLGLNAQESWNNLINGKSGIVVHKFDQYPQIHAAVAGIVQEFDPKKALSGLLPLKEIRRVHRSAQFALSATLEALQQAGLLTANEGEDSINKKWVINSSIADPREIAAIIGTGIGGGEAIAQVQENLKQGKTAEVFHIFHALPERVVTPVAKAFGIKGPIYSPIAACATGNIAITNGIKDIMSGDAKFAIVGGTEAVNVPIGMAMFDVLGALDREPDPTKTPRPLDKSAGGFVMGEGAGVLILERYDVAKKRGARILAEITGYGNTSDAYHDTEPSGDGAERAMRIARNRSYEKRLSGPIYINPHATATPTGDPVEIKAIRNEYGEGIKNVAGISATKGATGHLMGAVGAVEAIFCIKALQEQVLPPTLRLENPIDEAKGLNLVPKEAQKGEFDHAQNNGFGFGGINSVVIFSRE